MSLYDIAIIGAGPAGYCAAIRAAQLGFRVACIDKRGLQGGTCLHEGCIPSKILLEVSHKFDERFRMDDWGIRCKSPRLDLDKVMQRKAHIVGDLSKGIAQLFHHHKIDFFADTAHFVDAHTLHLESNDEDIGADIIIIATGSTPIALPALPFDGQKIVSSTEALHFDDVPNSLAIVGGGVIGLELGSVWHRFGSEVTIIEAQDRILSTYDEDVVRILQHQLQTSGMNFATNTLVTAAQSKRVVRLNVKADDKRHEWKFDKVIVAVGRQAHTEGLNLEGVGVALDAKGRVITDRNAQTSRDHIFAVGDVTTGPMLAHKASEEAVFLIERLKGHKVWLNPDAIPDVVYTYPELASVGKTEAQCVSAGMDVKIGTFHLRANSRARVLQQAEGLVKIIIDAASERILGATILSPEAGTMIAEITHAIEMGASAEDLAHTCHAHPTLNEAVKEAALAAYDRPLHSA